MTTHRDATVQEAAWGTAALTGIDETVRALAATQARLTELRMALAAAGVRDPRALRFAAASLDSASEELRKAQQEMLTGLTFL